MFRNLDKDMELSRLEREVLESWDKEDAFASSVRSREDGPPFVFYEGPPTANGAPGLHHVMARSVKDTVCRYKTMQGYHVRRKAGWDTHGLPVEIEVQKRLGLENRKEIESFGIEAFNKACRESVFSYKDMWERLTREMGYWIDLDHPYITLENNYIESVWWILKRFHDSGLIYKGYRVVPYCPRCETPLSSHEVAQGYKDVSDPSITIVIKTLDAPFDLLVWTTTPWTLVSNVAVAVGKDVDYAVVSLPGRDRPLVLAKNLVGAVTGSEAVILREMKGSELLGLRYHPVFDYLKPDKPAHRIIGGDFVSTEDGTGLVHIAPAFGEDDYRVAKENDLPMLNPVDGRGCFSASVPPWAGKFVKDADPDIITDIKRSGRLFRSQKHVHSYPHCWRCDSPLIYYARDAWYIRMTELKQKLIDANARVDWHPAAIGEGRFGKWLENLQDWSISRDRYWGTPLNIWVCENASCLRTEAIGSRGELSSRGGAPGDMDLHKPFIDAVSFKCSACGATMRRTPEVIDCWFDSGAMPFAQAHYPFEHEDDFGEHFPADFISEGIDQTRGWFYSLLAIAVFVKGESPYRNVVVNELILDRNGQKMSKTRGNAVDPFALLEKYGADVVRWYLLSTTSVWLPIRFDEDAVVAVKRKFFDTVLNTYRFFVMYANVDGFALDSERVPVESRPTADRWLLTRMNSVIRDFTIEMDRYDITKALNLLSDFFVEEVSNWYVRLNRRRFWKEGRDEDKRAAYCTLQEILVVVSRLMAPAAPFLSDFMHRQLSGEGTVHESFMPEPDEGLADDALEAKMLLTRRIVELGRKLRTEHGLKVRQPLPEIIVQGEGEVFDDIVLAELNVKKYTLACAEGGFVRKSAKPDFKKLGPLFGKKVQVAAEAIRGLDAERIAEAEAGRELSLETGGEILRIPAECVLIQTHQIQGMAVASDGNLQVALRTELSEELIREGLFREFVNRIQNLRKDCGLEITDRICLHVKGDDALVRALKDFKEGIDYELLSKVEFPDSLDKEAEFRKAFELDGLAFEVAMSRVRRA